MRAINKKQRVFGSATRVSSENLGKAARMLLLGLEVKQWIACLMITALLSPVLNVSAATSSEVGSNRDELVRQVADTERPWSETLWSNAKAKLNALTVPSPPDISGVIDASLGDDDKPVTIDDATIIEIEVENGESSYEFGEDQSDSSNIPESENNNNEGSEISAPQPSLFLGPTDQEIRDASYSLENNVGTPPYKPQWDSPNTAAAEEITHNTGNSNYSFELPFASLPGRGIDASVGMTYNSRVWNKTQGSYQFNVDKNWLAPGFTVGYGTLSSHFEAKSVITTDRQNKTYNHVVPDGYTDANGTRHKFDCTTLSPIPGMVPNSTYCSEYVTKDGTFVKLDYYGARPISNHATNNMSAYAGTYFVLHHSDGTEVTYSIPGAQYGANDYYRDHYPTRIRDRNGNQIDIVYKDGKDTIDYIKDTLGRYIKFYYDPSATKKLVAVTVPGFNGGTERQTIRFYYDENVSLNHQGWFPNVVTAPATIRTLRYVYFPATGAGYRYDYHPNFGMITKITKLAGMMVSGDSTTSTGTVTSEGSIAATTEYAFPSGTPSVLSDVPKFSNRVDDWQGRTSSAAITTYAAPEPSPGSVERISTTTVVGPAFDVEYKTISHNTTDLVNGLPKETAVTKVGSGQPVAKTKYTWGYATSGPSAWVPRIDKLEITNDAGQARAVTFSYDGYNNKTVISERDFAASGSLGTELRRTEATYESGQTNQGWMNNRLFHLPKEIKTIVNGVAVSKVAYEYDNYSGLNALAPATGVIQHDPGYDPQTGTYQCNCHYECTDGSSGRFCADGSPAEWVCETCTYDPVSNYRGNVTKVTSFSDATAATASLDPLASVNTVKYDITGNVVEATMNCCNVKTLEYSASNYYAYVTKETKGSSSQLINQAAYDFNTGLTTSVINENGQPTYLTYDAATLRQTRVDLPDGGWSTTEYNDTQLPYSIKTTSSIDSTRSTSSYRFFNGRGESFRTAVQTTDGWNISAVEFDSLGRPVKSYNPFYGSTETAGIPTGTKFTQVTDIDALGRTKEVTLQDLTKVNTYPNEATVSYTTPNSQTVIGTATRVKDQAGKERRQIVDALGRIRRVDEPNAAGSLGTVTAPAQPTHYEYDGNDNLSKVIQSDGTNTQERRFKYDSLSRLVAEKQVEANATLDINGTKGTIDPVNKFTKVLKYNSHGLLTDAYDARGVRTQFTYDGLNRIKTVAYSGETGYKTPSVTYHYDQSRSGYFNIGALTRVETAQGDLTLNPDTPATSTEFDYDNMGRVSKHRQWIGTQQYDLEYTYNLGGQLVSEKYPSGRIVTNSYDAGGRLSSVADGSRTYMSDPQYLGKGGSLSSVTLGNGTTQTFALNDRFQMEQQELKKGSEVLQKYAYGYGQIDISTGNLDATKNKGQLGRIESYIGTSKQWTQRLSYDSIGRLKQAEEKRGDTNALTYKQSFDFDRFGNMYRKTSSNPTTGQQNPLPYTPIEDSDISKSSNRFTINTTYDDVGNVVTDNKFRTMGFAYDANGRMVKATKTSVPDAFSVYDASGLRVAERVNDVWRFLIYDIGGKLVAEYGGPQSTDEGGVKYMLSDWQGSTRAVVGNTGNIQSRMDYTAYGEDIGTGVGLRTATQGFGSTNNPRQKYALTESDEATGLEHTWFRKNETRAGRWTSPDPYGGSVSILDPQSLNRYSYVNNDPSNLVDPSGLIGNPGMCWTGEDGIFRCNSHVPIDFTIRKFDGFTPKELGGGTRVETTTSPLGDECTLVVNITKAGSSGLSSGSSSGTAGAQSGPYNHAYVTLRDSAGSAYATGYRAGPSGVGLPVASTLEGHSGLYAAEFFKDFEKNPSGAVIETYEGDCSSLDKAFQSFIRRVNNQNLPYALLRNNSNSFVYSMLMAAGIDANTFTPRINAALGSTGFLPGWGHILPLK